MTQSISFPVTGGCACKAVRYQLEAAPLVIHCCHCRWCQRETGTAFALNAMIETSKVKCLGEQPQIVHTPSESGKGQKYARCSTCNLAVWSNYGDSGDLIRFIRVGTLDNPDQFPPNVHIFTSSKQPWVLLGDRIPVFEEYYNRKAVWDADKLERLAEARRTTKQL